MKKDGVTREARILEQVYALSAPFIELRGDPHQRIPYNYPYRPHPRPGSGLALTHHAITSEEILYYILEVEVLAGWTDLDSDESIPEKKLYSRSMRRSLLRNRLELRRLKKRRQTEQ